MRTNNFDEANTLLKEASTVAIFMHINPDPDCVGSALALYGFLSKAGKRAYVFTPDTRTTDMIAQKMHFLPFFNRLNKCDVDSFDLSIAVDLGETGRIGDYALPLFFKGNNSLVIDHHETFVDFANVSVRDTGASSAAQLLYEIMISYDKTLIDKDIATLLYAGIVTDSGNFSYECTSKKTFAIASDLLEYGVEYSAVTRKLTKEIELSAFRLKNKALAETRFFCDNKMALIIFRKQDFINTHTTEKDTDGIINEIQNIKSVFLAISVSEVGYNSFKVSFRSKENVSAKACAESFGGGGHFYAAGCRLVGREEDILSKIIDAGKKQLLYV